MKLSAWGQYQEFYNMLSDKVRMESFKKAISQELKRGDIVVDLGAGTGVLGFFALQAGASKVYAIEQSQSIDLARDIATHNNWLDRIEFINDCSLNVNLPEKVDVLVSETLGSFGLDENTLEYTIDARNRFLKPNGLILPQTLVPFLAPVQADSSFAKLEFWQDVYGINYEPARHLFAGKIMIEDIAMEQLLAAPQAFTLINLYEHNLATCHNKLVFPIHQPGLLHGFVGWFGAEITAEVEICTAPFAPQTHWRQAYFPVSEPVTVGTGDYVEIDLEVAPGGRRADDSSIAYTYRCTQINRVQDGPSLKQSCP